LPKVKLTDEQLAEKDMLDTLRTVVRLKHRIDMRHELNELEAEALEAQERAIANGEPFRLDLGRVVRELEDGSE
jgi:hypothetical protein